MTTNDIVPEDNIKPFDDSVTVSNESNDSTPDVDIKKEINRGNTANAKEEALRYHDYYIFNVISHPKTGRKDRTNLERRKTKVIRMNSLMVKVQKDIGHGGNFKIKDRQEKM